MKYILCFITIILLFSCDEVSITRHDISKYPWLQPFVYSDLSNFEGTHNIDRGILSFSHRTSKSKESIFSELDSIAQIEQWKTISSTINSREYSKRLPQYEVDTSIITLTVALDTNTNKLMYKIN